MPRIFISHSSEDREQSARLLQWLHGQGFASTFLDFDKHYGIAVGAGWEHRLYRELSSADAMILILTRNWFDSKWCFAEFTQARALGKAIFPLIEAPTGETFVAPDIQHLDLIKDREGGLEHLLSELTRIALDTRGGFPWDGARPPYPGLLAFDEADAAIYFGRDDDIRRLIERLNARRAQGGEKLVLVLGASGAGKSSLLRAGVVPRLKRDARNWIVLPPFRPQLHPLDELAQVVAAGLGRDAEWRRWREALAGGDLEHLLSNLARDLRAAHKQTEAQILLVIDQGEELFAGADREQTGQFFRVLNALLDDRLPFLAVMALRSDALGVLQQEPRLEASFEQFSLKPMPLERVREIIEGPANVAGVAVDDGLVTAAGADARTEDALPLLAFALRELYDRFASSGRLTAESYRALGDAQAQLSPLENAVRRKADEVLATAKPAPEDLGALKEAFIPAMVRVNPEGEYVRRPARIESVPPRAMPLIERLAKARLLTIREEQGVRMVEVAHEALLRKWPLLRAWLDEEREFLVGKDQLEQDLHDWESAALEQKSDALLAGLKLTRARMWLAEKPQQLSARERTFIQASVARQEAEAAQRERARRRVLRGTVAAAAVLAMVALGALWEWRQARVEQRQALSRQLAAESVEDAASNLGTALRDAVDAAEAARTSEAEIALNAALENPRERFILHHNGWRFTSVDTFGHQRETVKSAAFSPDGSRVVTASGDQTARVWDAQSGRLLFTLEHQGEVNDAEFSPDGKRIVTASDDHTAQVWDAGDGHRLVTLEHPDLVLSAAFSPDGQRIATAGWDGAVRVWDAASGQFLKTLSGDANVVNSAVFSPDGKRIATAGNDMEARVWDAASGQCLATLVGHTGWVYSANFSPDGTRIVTASNDMTARIWDAQSGQSLATLNGHLGAVNSAVYSPDGYRIVTAGADGTARVWNAANGQLLVMLAGHTGSIDSAVFSPDSSRILTASDDHTARVWDAQTGRLQATLTGHARGVRSAVFSRDGERIVTAGGDDTARIWDAGDGRQLATLEGHAEKVNSAVFSPDGKRIVTASDDGTARVWDAGSGEMLAELSGHTNAVICAAFSPDGARIVTASQDGTARLWDAGGHLLAELSGHNGAVYSAVFSPDGKRIVTASEDKTARVWDGRDGHPLLTLSGHNGAVYSAVFSPDSKRIVTASADGAARVWDASDGRPSATLLATFPLDRDAVSNITSAMLEGKNVGVLSAQFSPDGKRIVTAQADGIVRVWDAGSGRLMFTASGHKARVNSAVFSPDGKRIVTASADETARVWDAADGKLLATLAEPNGAAGNMVQTALAGHNGSILCALFSGDGTRIVTASADGTARVWDAGDGRLLATLAGHKGAVNSAMFSPDCTRVVTAGDDWTAKVYVVSFGQLLGRAKQLLPVDSGN